MQIDTSPKSLKSFGIILSVFLPFLFLVVFPLFHGGGINLFKIHWTWYAGASVLAVALIFPLALKPVYIVWMFFGKIIGHINNIILLTVLYFIVIVPLGLAMKLIGKDPLKKKINQDKSYMVKYHQTLKERFKEIY